jgi:hypothetical protein
VGVDIPDNYYDIYSKANPHGEKVDIKSLEVILQQLSGLPLHLRQKVRTSICYLQKIFTPNTFFFVVSKQVMSLVAAPEAEYVTRNEFNAYLALIACGQKNMGNHRIINHLLV